MKFKVYRVDCLTLPCVVARSVVDTIVCTSLPPMLAFSVAWGGGREEGGREEEGERER